MDKKLTILDRINFWLLWALILFLPLYPKFPLLSVAGTYVAIRGEDFLITLVVVISLFSNIKNIKRIFSKTITHSFLLFWAIGFLAFISALFVSSTVSEGLGLLHWLRRVEYMVLFFVAATTIKNLRQVRIILISLLVATIFIVFYGFGQMYLNFDVISTTNREFSKGQVLKLTPGARPNSTFAGHYDLAAYLSIVLTFVASIFLIGPLKIKSAKDLINKSILASSGLISFALLGFTAARVSFAATLISIASVMWLTGKKKLIGLLVIASIIIVLVSPQLRDRLVATVRINLLDSNSQTYVAPPTPSPLPSVLHSKTSTASAQIDQKLKEATEVASKSATIASDIAPGEPLDTTELGVYRSYNIRLNVEWPRAVRALAQNPILGTGYSSITIATDNDYLRSLGEVGLLGTLAFGLVFLVITKRLIKTLPKKQGLEKAFIIAALCSILTIAITSTFIDVLEASKIATLFWIMLGIAWAITTDYEDL